MQVDVLIEEPTELSWEGFTTDALSGSKGILCPMISVSRQLCAIRARDSIPRCLSIDGTEPFNWKTTIQTMPAAAAKSELVWQLLRFSVPMPCWRRAPTPLLSVAKGKIMVTTD